MTNKYFYGWNRINKTTARRLFNAGHDILFNPVNMPVRRDFYCMHVIANKKGRADFDKLCNAYQYYNCDNETGRYPAFYVKEY